VEPEKKSVGGFFFGKPKVGILVVSIGFGGTSQLCGVHTEDHLRCVDYSLSLLLTLCSQLRTRWHIPVGERTALESESSRTFDEAFCDLILDKECSCHKYIASIAMSNNSAIKGED
jgi:hypothetical protein